MESYVYSQLSKQNSATNAWNVNFNNGNANNNTKTNTNRVRPVSDFCDNPSSDFLDFASTVVEAYIKCLKNKKNNPNAAFYALRGMTSTISLALEVWTGNYKISPGIIFIVYYPIPREVCAANFRDRIIHVWVMDRMEPILEMVFPDAITANRKGRGTDGAIRLANEAIKKLFGEDAWVFISDFQGFFMGIDKRIVNDEAQGLITEMYEGRYEDILRRLFRDITFNRPQLTARRRSPDSAWDGIPPQKSLYHCDEYHGLAIGNLPSQWSACLVMMLVVRLLERFGIRQEDIVTYMDDMIIFIRDKEKFLKSLPSIEAALRDELCVRLHPRKRNLQHVSKGWKIVGGKGRNGRVYPSDRSVRRMNAKIHYLCNGVHDTKAMFDTMNSYLGLMKRFRSYKIRRNACMKVLESYGNEMYFTEGFEKAVMKNRYNERKMIYNSIKSARKYE